MLKLIGFPFDHNSSFLKGPALAPAKIRLMETLGSANCFSENGLEIVNEKNYQDVGDQIFESTESELAFKTIKGRVAKEIADGSKLISFGGDHSISFPIIDAFTEKYSGLNVIHFDAHPDLYDNFENNPYSHASPFARLMEKGKVKSLTQVGIRTFNKHQREQAKRFNVNVIEMKDFSELQFQQHVLNSLSEPLYISIDLDVLDPAFAPGISHHEPGGLSTRQLLSCLQQISVPVVGAYIVEYNSTRDVNDMTAMVGYKVFKEVAAKMVG
jgi:agmatinase